MLRILILAIGLSASLVAVAQVVRSIPVEARRAQIEHVEGTTIRMSGKKMQLSAGAQIRDTSNRIIQPTAVPPRVLVKYTLDTEGSVHRVWILTQQEAAQRDKAR
jgi:hypothetical protein